MIGGFKKRPVSNDALFEELDREYFEKLPRAAEVALWSIRKYFERLGYGPYSLEWLQTSLQRPAFQHLCFRLKNKVYSILIGIKRRDGILLIRDQDIENQKRECLKNNLIPCVFPMREEAIDSRIDYFAFPLVSTYALSGEKIDVDPETMDFDKSERLSEWEINNFGIAVTRAQIRKEGHRILSYCDIIGVKPSIWFEKNGGKKALVFVDTKWIQDERPFDSIVLDSYSKAKFSQFEHYKAEVKLYDMKNPESELRRDSEFCYDAEMWQFADDDSIEI